MERWRQIESLFQEALNKSPAERSRWLRQACHGDSGLLRELESLLVNHHAATSSAPWAAEAAAQLLGAPESLEPGQNLGPYQIVSFLAAGGMGAVYRAHDPRTGRDVAIKVAAHRFSERFAREVRAVAALNHPNICTLFDVGPNYLVMELVEGESPKGPLPVETALHYAMQIADALESAHEKGIVHRDLKPGNIKIKTDGTVKVLDFGLAQVNGPPVVHGDDSPTISLQATEAGVILGTAAYMSPEQARGKAVDKRADIWAFGVVLYEMVTGKRLFEGENVSDTLGGVLTKDPDWNLVPMSVRRLLQRCLEKDPKKRLRDIGEARFWLSEEEPSTTVAGRPYKWWTAIAVLAAALVVAIALWAPWRGQPVTDRPLVRLNVDLGPEATLGDPSIAISPDGSRIVFPVRSSDGKRRLAIQQLDQDAVTPLAGTENGLQPFFSPDGQWIEFYADAKVKKISVQGSAAVTLCEFCPFWGGAGWNGNNSIIASMYSGGTSGLFLIPSNGVPTRLTDAKELTDYGGPQILPGGNALLYGALSGGPGAVDMSLSVRLLKTGETKTLVHNSPFGRYVTSRESGNDSGYLLYISQRVLYAARFDLARLELQGGPVPLAEGLSGFEPFDISQTGTVVYRSGRSEGWSIAWVENSGKTSPVTLKPAPYFTPRLSPDGQLLAFAQTAQSGRGTDIFIHDWRRDTTSPLTLNGTGDFIMAWAPDGKHIVYRSGGNATASELLWVRADGTGEPQRLLQSDKLTIPSSVSPDGRIAYNQADPQHGLDIWTLPVDIRDTEHPKPGTPEPFAQTAAAEEFPVFSPDGKWIAYESDASGQMEVYVRPFPGPGGPRLVSAGGGSVPVWSHNGQQIFYQSPDNHIMIVDCTISGAAFVASKPRLWSNVELPQQPTQTFDLAPDGQRVVALVKPTPNSGETKESAHVTFLLNVFDELRRRFK